jgi:hypothetical protein
MPVGELGIVCAKYKSNTFQRMNMKATVNGEEVKNLVMFPSAKNFPMREFLSDPLSEILNEYTPYYPDHDDERFPSEPDEDESTDMYPSLEAFMNRHQRDMAMTPDDRLIQKINQQMDAIQNLKERIKFYMDEIEMFLPRKR